MFERHKSGKLHVHFIVSDAITVRNERRSRRLARLWGHGFVDARRLGGSGSGARRGARYASKYVAKGSVAGFGGHSYEVRQGFQPAAVRVEGGSAGDVWAQLVRNMGGELPAFESWSSSWSDYRGPPAGLLSWA